jgi:hypothetical protein
MGEISASVGEGGTNLSADVVKVQELLNAKGLKNGALRPSSAARLAPLMLLAACTRSPESKSAEPAQSAVSAKAEAVAEPSAPTPEPAVQAVPAPATPTPAAAPAPAAAPPGTPIPEAEHALFDVLVRLVNEPAAISELAPKAKFEDYGTKGLVKRPIKDAKADFGFVFDELHAALITAATPAKDYPSTPIECDAKKLSCQASYGGGQTDFLFAREGDKVVLTKVIKQLN